MPDLFRLGVWINKKNKHRYLVTGVRINADNGIDPLANKMVEYENKEGERFIRSMDEFLEKFYSVDTL